MRNSSPLVTISLLLLVIMPAIAAQRVVLHNQSVSELQKTITLFPDPASKNTIKSDTLSFISEHHDAKNVTHTRMQQEYLGFPVYGGHVILHQKPGSLVQAAVASGAVYSLLAPDLGLLAPQHFADHADPVLKTFQANYAGARLSQAQVEPVIYIDSNDRAVWAYDVRVFVQYSSGVTKNPRAFIDAQNYQTLFEWDDLKLDREPANGIGYGGNTLTGKKQFGKNRPYLNILRDNELAQCYMENPDVMVLDMLGNLHSPLVSMMFPCSASRSKGLPLYWTGYSGNGYDKINGAYSVANDALYIGHVIQDMYRTWYGLDVLTRQNKPMQLIMRIHYGNHYGNAFWDGQQMTFGDGLSWMYPLVSLGVGAHEITHGFTEQHANLAYYAQSGGLNESFSDMSAQAAEYYTGATNTWQIGGDILKAKSGYIALRFMDQPSLDGHSIDSADQYRTSMDVHYSSGVYNRFFYLLSTQANWDPKKSYKLMLKANMDYWIPTTTFEEASCGVLQAASDLNFSVHDIRVALNAVGLYAREC